MASDLPTKRIKLANYLLGIVLLLAGGLVALWLATQGASPVSTSPSEINDAAGSLDPQPRAPAAGPASLLSGGVSEDELSASTLAITFVTYEGPQKVGVYGLEVELADPESDSDEPTVRLRTNSDGLVVAQVPSNSTVNVSLRSSAWRLPSASRRFFRTSVSVYVGTESTDLELLVEPVSQLLVNVAYEDGRAYSGFARVSAASGPPQQVSIAEGEPLPLMLSSRQTWTLYADSRRPGFEAGSLVLAADHEGEVQTLVLRRSDRETGVFEVVCGDFADDSLIDIRISAQGDHVTPSTLDTVSGWPARMSYFSKALSPGNYDVRVQTNRRSPDGGSQVGVEVAALYAGQVHTVRVGLAQTGSVRVRIVDENNAPIPRARLALALSEYFNWGWARSRPAGYQHPGIEPYALSRDDGIAVLSGLPPGPLSVLCDAEGYGLVALQADVQSGREHDLGTVALHKAAGSIRIEILHPEAAEAEEYEVTLLRPLGVIVRSAERFSGKAHVIDGLNLLSFVVSIRHVAGTHGAFAQRVTLTEEASQATVTFRMQKPPLQRD